MFPVFVVLLYWERAGSARIMFHFSVRHHNIVVATTTGCIIGKYSRDVDFINVIGPAAKQDVLCVVTARHHVDLSSNAITSSERIQTI